MLRWLDHRISLSVVVALFPLAFLIHDGEEILTTEPWVAANRERLLALAQGTPLQETAVSMTSMTTAAFTWAVLALLVLILIGTGFMLRAIRQERGSWMAAPFLTMSAIYTLNIVTHLGQSIIWGGYTPGVVTAVLVMIPYAYYLYRRLLQARLFPRWALIASYAAGLALGMPLVLAVHALGRYLAG
jgi:hypothetical protein